MVGARSVPSKPLELLTLLCHIIGPFSLPGPGWCRTLEPWAAGVVNGAKVGPRGWEREFERWLTPFLDALGDARGRRWAPVYVRGLLGAGERTSIEPLAARVAPDDYQQVHHFVCASCWDPEPLERVLTEKAQAMAGSPEAVLIVDDTALLKKGTCSVGVARQ